jgi:hypothetical protein
MPKDTPFFKFDSSSWLGGSIQFTSLQCKGLFIDLCALYWESNEPVKIDNKLRLRIRVLEGDLSDLIRDLSDLNIIAVSDCGVTIPFLDELRQERVKFLERCSQGGKNSTRLKGKSSNKKEERRKKKEECRKENVDNKENSSEPVKTAHSSDLNFDYKTGLFEKEIPEAWMQVWIDAYPAVDILSEVNRAKAWLFANPKKRKKDHKAYLNNWLARCQKSGGNIASNQVKKPHNPFQ